MYLLRKGRFSMSNHLGYIASQLHFDITGYETNYNRWDMKRHLHL